MALEQLKQEVEELKKKNKIIIDILNMIIGHLEHIEEGEENGKYST